MGKPRSGKNIINDQKTLLTQDTSKGGFLIERQKKKQAKLKVMLWENRENYKFFSLFAKKTPLAVTNEGEFSQPT
ncbi:MAG: hypothetical protein LBV07_00960 [Syntrophobacterales bacterium]|nr:hypothetical protein [Syntrophobacterales bacterium]